MVGWWDSFVLTPVNCFFFRVHVLSRAHPARSDMGGAELLLARIMVGAMSGGIASFCSCPIEVCLVRMQVRIILH